jgi:DNA-binding beta-propeller fold protein YncE
MTTTISRNDSKAEAKTLVPRIYFLDISANRVVAANADGSDPRVVVTDCRMPDGIAIDVAAGHIYWTNMGKNLKKNDGSIERADVDGKNRVTIVPEGATFTPKQLQLDTRGRKIYWCDREGMRVMRANIDGSNIETLVEGGRGDTARLDARNWCVGIVVDLGAKHIYWTQKGADNANQGRLFRAGLDLPPGQGPATRSDIELLFDKLPEPIDLELDHPNGMLYWTDRGDPPAGNSVNRAPIHPAPGTRARPDVLVTHLMEAIGLALDRKGGRMFVTDMAGTVYTASLDGKGLRPLLIAQGNLTGIAYAELPR